MSVSKRAENKDETYIVLVIITCDILPRSLISNLAPRDELRLHRYRDSKYRHNCQPSQSKLPASYERPDQPNSKHHPNDEELAPKHRDEIPLIVTNLN